MGNGFNWLAADHGRKHFYNSKKREHVSSPAERLLAFQGRHAFWLI
jgi:hypothetical protein